MRHTREENCVGGERECGRLLAARLLAAEDQLRQLRARRREDARANARAAEIFAGHRAAWMEAERRLLARAAAAGDEAASLRARLADAEADAAALRARVERLEREAAERDELLTALLAATSRAGEEEGERVLGDEREEDQDPVPVPPLDPPQTTDAEALAAAAALYAQQRQKHDDFYTAATAASGMPPWMDPSKGWQVRSEHDKKVPPATLFSAPHLLFLSSSVFTSNLARAAANRMDCF